MARKPVAEQRRRWERAARVEVKRALGDVAVKDTVVARAALRMVKCGTLIAVGPFIEAAFGRWPWFEWSQRARSAPMPGIPRLVLHRWVPGDNSREGAVG